MQKFSLLILLSCSFLAIFSTAFSQALNPPAWSRENAQILLMFTNKIAEDGLDPERYNHQLLSALLDEQTGEVASRALSDLATAISLKLAHDLEYGYIAETDRPGWRLESPSVPYDDLKASLVNALLNNQLDAWLTGLAPINPDYSALKMELKSLSAAETAKRQTILVNLERWRWMPRDLPSRYLRINIPSFAIELIENDQVIAQNEVIVGKLKRSTPIFNAIVQSVTFNPWWRVPPSIVRESIGSLIKKNPKQARRLGYVVIKPGDIRQKPGPLNALGKVKLNMPNAFNIYLHDTPSKNLFSHPVRTFSHGCIRIKYAIDFVEIILKDETDWDRYKIDDALERGKTTTVRLTHPLPVYVVYFTALLNKEGKIDYLPDPYNYDAAFADTFLKPLSSNDNTLNSMENFAFQYKLADSERC